MKDLIFRFLKQHPKVSGTLTIFELRKGRLLEGDRAGTGGKQSGHNSQKRGFSCAIIAR
ncbi:hypothetical protein TUM17580_36300 [Citrobacter farmeri]|nr:hypothetical protein TUM17580_36300 [Citrobacter farmeri]